MKKFNITNKYFRWFLLLSVCGVYGCASLPEKEKIWPWEYGRGQGEPNTGDYIAFRAGIAKFGEPPKVVKPIKPESAEPNSTDVLPVAETFATKTVPSAAAQQRTHKANSNKKNGYDFRLSENKSTAADLRLNTSSPVYDIIAFNYGNAPVSVAIDIDKGSTQNASADKTLPYYAVVPAHTDQPLVRFSAKMKEQGFKFRYNSGWSIGDYTTTHHCPEQYQFPFGEKIRAYAHVINTTDDMPYTRNAVVFSMPKGTPVLAARKGVVIQISSDGKIDILHEDSTIGTYYHLQKIDDYVVVGKTVSTDDVIGVAGTSENNKDAYIQLTVWRPEPKASDKLQTSSQQIGFEAVSYPLAFKSASSGKGKILTKNQPVSRDKLPPSNKQTKRK